MRRPLLLAAVLVLAGCGEVAPAPFTASRAAEPQQLDLSWRESYPPGKPGLVFEVESLQITEEGWVAKIAVTNTSDVAFAAGGTPPGLAYGVMLFTSGDLGELEGAASAGTLPAVRKARTIEPAPPETLEPGRTWRATLAAPGALAAGSWARIVFGPLRARGQPPKGVEAVVVWISDHAAEL